MDNRSQKSAIKSIIKSNAIPSENLGRAYGSMMLSILSYGYNIAVRRPFPSSQYAYKETGRPTTIESEELYLRASDDHPGRKSIGKIKDKIEKIQVRLNTAIIKHEMLLKYISNDKNQIKLFSDLQKKANTDKALSGQLRNMDTINPLLSNKIRSENNNTLTEIIDVINHEIRHSRNKLDEIKAVIAEKNIMRLLDEGIHKPFNHQVTQDEIKKYKGNASAIKEIKDKSNNTITYGQWITPEMCVENVFSMLPIGLVLEICNELVDEIKYLENSIEECLETFEKSPRINSDKANESPEYPEQESLSHSSHIRRNISLVQHAYELYEKNPKSDYVKMVKPVTDYPCIVFDLSYLIKSIDLDATRNDYDSEKRYLNNFINTYFCALLNFHSMRTYGPDNVIWTETNNSFGSLRPSITDTGESFRFSPGLVPDDFNSVISLAYVDLVQSLSKPKMIDYLKEKTMICSGFMEKYQSLKMEDKTKVEKDFPLYVLNDRDGKRGIMHMKAFELIANDAENSLLNYINFIFTNKASILPSINKEEIYNTVINNSTHTSYQTAMPASEARILLQRLEDRAVTAISSTCDNESIVGRFEASINGTLQLLINTIVKENYFNDYSMTCSCIEHLMRLLKIKEDFNKIHYYNTDEYKESGYTELSDDSVLSHDAYASNGGMKGFTDCMSAIYPYLDPCYLASQDNTLKDMRDDVYFEIKENAPDVIKSLITYIEANKNQSGSGISIEIAELAQSPTYGISKKSKWAATSDWTNIENKPDILIIDITASTADEVYDTITKMHLSCKNSAPYCIVTFSSDNKCAQVVDLVFMGEVRIHPNPAVERLDSSRKDQLQTCIEQIRGRLIDNNENTLAARSVRKVLSHTGVRRSLTESHFDAFEADRDYIPDYLMNVAKDNYQKYKNPHGNFGTKNSKLNRYPGLFDPVKGILKDLQNTKKNKEDLSRDRLKRSTNISAKEQIQFNDINDENMTPHVSTAWSKRSK